MAVFAAVKHMGKMTDEQIDKFLCSEIYHCLPSQLDEEDAERILEHLAVIKGERMSD